MVGQKCIGTKYVKINKRTHKREIVKNYMAEKVQNINSTEKNP